MPGIKIKTTGDTEITIIRFSIPTVVNMKMYMGYIIF